MASIKKADMLSSILGNMALAHEMIINDDFKLKAMSEVAENSLEKSVHDIVHKAFWDVLETEITSDPPVYQNVFNLLVEMKGLIQQIIPNKSESMKKELGDVLDENLILQQIEHETFDICGCASFILSFLSKLCAPVRDQKIKELKEETSIVILLRGALELINMMKLDLANYEISTLKPILIQQAVQYEKTKFAEFLNENKDGLQITNAWLRGAHDIIKSLRNPKVPTKITAGMVITHAYLSLLMPKENRIVPETLLLDEVRLFQASLLYEKLTYVISIITYCINFIPSHLSTDVAFINHLKDTILILLADSKCDESTMESIFLQMIAEVEKECKKREIGMNPDSSILNRQLKDLLAPDNQLRGVIESRIRDYVLLTMTSQTLVPPSSSVLLPVKDELKEVTVQFVRVIKHNKRVHYTTYDDMVNNLLKEEEENTKENTKENTEENTKENTEENTKKDQTLKQIISKK